MSKVDVSIVLPVYQGVRWISAAIESVLNQTCSNWELLILDDGSTDGSYDLSKEYANRDSRIKAHRHEVNRGLAATMNELVAMAHGKYIAVQEQDDISVPDRLAKELDILEVDSEIGLVSGVAGWMNAAGELYAYFPGILHRGFQYPQDKIEMVKYLYIEQCKVVNAACMFRKEIISEILPTPFDQNAKMSIDWQFFLHVAHRYRIWGIPEMMVVMNRGEPNTHLSGNKTLQFFEARRCIRKIFDEYSVDPQSPIARALYRQALSSQLTLEGRYYGRIRGSLKLLAAIFYDPGNRLARKSFSELVNRAGKKFRESIIAS